MRPEHPESPPLGGSNLGPSMPPADRSGSQTKGGRVLPSTRMRTVNNDETVRSSVYHQEIVRDLPQDPPAAYSWLTDYQPSDSAIFGMESGLRSVQRIDATHFRLTNPLPNSSLSEISDVTLEPPSKWRQNGQLLRGHRKLATFTVAYSIAPSAAGSRITTVLELTPVGWLGRFLVALRWKALTREFEHYYDQIAGAATADARIPRPATT